MKIFNMSWSFLYLVIFLCSACGSRHMTTNSSPLFGEIKIGDCIQLSDRVGFDYLYNLKKASSGNKQSMRAILEIGGRAHFDGSAATAHRKVLWELFVSQRQTFLNAYKTLPLQHQESVKSRIREALETDFNQ